MKWQKRKLVIGLCVENLDILPKSELQESLCGQIYSVLGARVMALSLVYVQVDKAHSNELNGEGEREGAVAVDEVEIVSYMK